MFVLEFGQVVGVVVNNDPGENNVRMVSKGKMVSLLTKGRLSFCG